VSHDFFASPHFEEVNGSINANDRGVNVVVEGTNGWALVDKVKVDRVAIENLRIETEKIKRFITITSCPSVTQRLDSTHVEQAIRARLVNI